MCVCVCTHLQAGGLSCFDDDEEAEGKEEEEKDGRSPVVANGFKHRLGAPEPASPSLCSYLTADDFEVHSRR